MTQATFTLEQVRRIEAAAIERAAKIAHACALERLHDAEAAAAVAGAIRAICQEVAP